MVGVNEWLAWHGTSSASVLSKSEEVIVCIAGPLSDEVRVVR